MKIKEKGLTKFDIFGRIIFVLLFAGFTIGIVKNCVIYPSYKNDSKSTTTINSNYNASEEYEKEIEEFKNSHTTEEIEEWCSSYSSNSEDVESYKNFYMYKELCD